MTSLSTKTILSLYKSLLRESEKFVDFNYRSYAMRRIKDSFRANAQLIEQASLDEKIELAKQNLELIKRQTTIGQLFVPKQQLSVEVSKDN